MTVPRRPLRSPLLAVIVVVLAMAGCSSGGSDGADGPTTAAAPSTTTGTTAATTTAAAPTTGSTEAGGELALSSSAFTDGGSIPARFACTQAGGQGDSPPLQWVGVPEGTATLVLVVHDPDAPLPGGFTHLVTRLGVASAGSVAAAANRSGGPMAAWVPMCPPSGEHHYRFTLFAFPVGVSVPAGADKAAIDALAPKALATTTVTGLFAKP